MELTQQTFQDLAKCIHRLCGLVISKDKMYLVRHRLEPVIQSHGLSGFEHLLQKLQSRRSTELQKAIIEAITTKETRFFRDETLFRAIRQQVLPECVKMLQRSTGSRHRIRMWSAGSSTGQEAYSLAMLIRELVDEDCSKELRDGQFTILATDISSEALESAKACRFKEHDVARGLSDNQLRRHFHRRGDYWILNQSVRRLVHFRPFNLLDSPEELGAFDLILCRNVLIYFDDLTRKRICRALHGVLQKGGWLVLGAAESLYGVEDRLEKVKSGRMVLYRKPDADE